MVLLIKINPAHLFGLIYANIGETSVIISLIYSDQGNLAEGKGSVRLTSSLR
jgi:hypothetical protein